MIPYADLEKALHRWKGRKDGTAPVNDAETVVMAAPAAYAAPVAAAEDEPVYLADAPAEMAGDEAVPRGTETGEIAISDDLVLEDLDGDPNK